MKKHVLTFLVISILLIPLSGCSSVHLPYKNTEKLEVIKKDGVSYFKGGTLKLSYGVPVLELKGNHYDIGLEYGVLLKDRLHSVYIELAHIERSVLRNIPLYLKFFVKVLVFVKLFYAKRHLPEKYIDEIKGISDGSGIAFNQILIASYISEIFNFSCTSFVKNTNDGILHGRNLDYYFPLIGENPVIVRYAADNEIPYTSVGCVGYIGTVTGMNDQGITVSVNAAPMVKTNGKDSGIPITLETREILANAKSLSDADDILSNYYSKKGWMLIVGSLSEKSGAVFNIATEKHSTVYMKGNAIFATNTFVDESFAHKYMALHEACSASTLSRLDEIRAHIGQINSVSSAVAVLENTDFYHYRGEIGLGDVTLNNEGTLQSVVMDPANHALYFSSDTMYSAFNTYYKFDTKDNTLSIYRSADKIITTDQFLQFKKWFSKAELLYLEGNFEKAFNFTKNIQGAYLIKLMGLEDTMEKLHTLDNSDLLIQEADKLIAKYPDYILPYLIKAKIYFKRKNYEKSIECANKGSDAAISFPYCKMENYYILAVSYYKLGDLEKAQYFAQKSVDFISQYRKGKFEKKIYSELNSILNRK